MCYTTLIAINTMDSFIIFIKHSCQEMNIHSLEDIATLNCVSKDIKSELDVLYKSDERKNELCKNTARNLGNINGSLELPKETVLNRPVYLQYMVQLNRYYHDDTIKNNLKRDKLVLFLNNFTSQYASIVFTKFSNISQNEQTETISELLYFTEENSQNIATKVLTTYLIYYFISKLYKRNGSHFIKNKKTCILASREFRFTCISKANEVIQVLKHEVMLFPFTFIDKVIRLVRETSRSLSQF